MTLVLLIKAAVFVEPTAEIAMDEVTNLSAM